MNGVYIRELGPDAFAARMLPWIEEAGLASAGDLEARREWLLALAPLVSERIKRMTEIVPMVRFLFAEEIVIDPTAAEKILAKDGAGHVLGITHDTLASLDRWIPEAIEEALRTVPEVLGMKPKAVFQVARVAIAGATVSLPLFESIALLGRDAALARLRAAQVMATP
jgi:glutamyl-tRNA synthetase